MHRSHRTPIRLLLALGLLAAPVAVAAQDFGETATWEYEIAAYAWFTGADGTGAVLGEEYAIDIETPPPWRPFDASLSFGVEARRGAWALWVDAALVKSEDDLALMDGSTGTFRVEHSIPGAAVSYRLLAGTAIRLEGLAGFRYSDLRLRASADTISVTSKENWLDPIAGLRLRGMLGPRFLYGLRADVGGFGVGSELTWNGQAALGYQTSARLVIGLGYRYFDTDYTSGDGAERFAFDASQHGLMAGLILLL